MNSASLKRSARLKRVDDLLADGSEYSTLEIVNKAQVCAVNSIISELRANGREINCRREKHVWYYKRINCGQ